jgi:arsenate reductase-like glutaredoxin family protein
MIYIYSMPMCSACIELKRKYRDKNIEFVERDGNRLKQIPIDVDDIDREAMVKLSMQNMVFPVEVEIEEESGRV